jgi:hypothetical protein
MGRASQKFDRQLLTRKLFEPAREMQMESLASDKAARSAKLAGSVLTRIVDGQLAVLRKWLETVDRICREVWQTQGETITPEFVREILVPEASMVIAARAGVTQSGVSSIAARTHEEPHGAWRWLAMEVNRLKGEVANRYEIEARELEYRNAAMADLEDKANRAEPRADQSVLPPGFFDAGDPVDGNPFPPNNPRHEIWKQATLKAEEEACQFNSQAMRNRPTAEGFAAWMERGGGLREFVKWVLMLHATRFGIWAERGCHVVWDENDLRVYV